MAGLSRLKRLDAAKIARKAAPIGVGFIGASAAGHIIGGRLMGISALQSVPEGGVKAGVKVALIAAAEVAKGAKIADRSDLEMVQLGAALSAAFDGLNVATANAAPGSTMYRVRQYAGLEAQPALIPGTQAGVGRSRMERGKPRVGAYEPELDALIRDLEIAGGVGNTTRASTIDVTRAITAG